MIPFPYSLGTRRLPPCAPDLCWPQAFKELSQPVSTSRYRSFRLGLQKYAFFFYVQAFFDFFFLNIFINSKPTDFQILRIKSLLSKRNKKKGCPKASFLAQTKICRDYSLTSSAGAAVSAGASTGVSATGASTAASALGADFLERRVVLVLAAFFSLV